MATYTRLLYEIRSCGDAGGMDVKPNAPVKLLTPPAPRPSPSPTLRHSPSRSRRPQSDPGVVNITRGARNRMEVAVTFDGGYEGEDTAIILDTLSERSIKATIFLTGTFIRRYPALVRRIVREGHEVGNHTMGHPHLTEFAKTYRHATLDNVDSKFLARELAGAAKIFYETTGAELTPLWRAPYGEINTELMRWAQDQGYVHVGWTYKHKTRESLDTLDWVTDTSSRLYRTAEEIKRRVLRFDHASAGVRGGIILMHLGTGRKVDKASAVLGEMIDELRARGYRFVKVSEMIAGNRVLEAATRVRSRRSRERVAVYGHKPGYGKIAMLEARARREAPPRAGGAGGAGAPDNDPDVFDRFMYMPRAERRAVFLLDP